MRCCPLFNSPQSFSVIPKPSFARIAIHTFTLLLYMQEGSYRLVFFFFSFLGSIQSKHTTTPHLPNTAYSHASVIGRAPDAMQNQALYGIRFSICHPLFCLFTSTASLSNHSFHPEQISVIASSRHNSPTNSCFVFSFSLSHHVYMWKQDGTKIQFEGFSTLCFYYENSFLSRLQCKRRGPTFTGEN